MNDRRNATLPRLVACLLAIACARGGRADDVGLVSASLTEQDGHAYVLEVDVPPSLIAALAPPVLPDRFAVETKPEYRRRGALVNVRYRFEGETPLAAEDVVLLPWGRSGVVLEARWRDGTRRTALFLRRIVGIPVPIRQLRVDVPSANEVFRAHWRRGVVHAATGWGHWMVIAAVLLLARPGRVLSGAGALIVGSATALVVSDVGWGAPSGKLADGLRLVAAVAVTRTSCGDVGVSASSRIVPVLVLAGVADGLALTAGLHGLRPAPEHLPLARAASVLGTAAVVLASTAGLTALVTLLRSRLRVPGRRVPAILVGSLAMAVLVAGVVASTGAVPATRRVDPQGFELLRSAGGNASAGAPAPRRLTHPFMVFLTVEPFEVRCEILAAAPAVVTRLGSSLRSAERIAIDEQEAIRRETLRWLGDAIELRLDDRAASAEVRRADFLTLSAGGAATRPVPVEEAVADAILGVTLVYATSAPPDRLKLTWAGLPETAGVVPVTLTSPDGVEGAELSARAPHAGWPIERGRFPRPEARAVAVVRPTWAPVSATLLGLGVVVGIGGVRAGARRRAVAAVTTGTVLAVVVFPVARAPAVWGAPLAAERAEQTLERLLTNVYRSFGARDEDVVYDRLAVSVAGAALTKVYLEQQHALALENRGGARARVDRIEVTQIDSITREAEGTLAVAARWTVSGSVDHFGHRHYRRNRYVALVRLRPVEGVWKIAGIEVLDERREL